MYTKTVYFISQISTLKMGFRAVYFITPVYFISTVYFISPPPVMIPSSLGLGFFFFSQKISRFSNFSSRGRALVNPPFGQTGVIWSPELSPRKSGRCARFARATPCQCGEVRRFLLSEQNRGAGGEGEPQVVVGVSLLISNLSTLIVSKNRRSWHRKVHGTQHL